MSLFVLHLCYTNKSNKNRFKYLIDMWLFLEYHMLQYYPTISQNRLIFVGADG